MHEPTDLVPLLEQALARVQNDPRRVWCKLSADFESRVGSDSAELCGGLWSPMFLGTEAKPAHAMVLEGETAVCRVAHARAPFVDWLPMLESAAQVEVQLLLATGEVDEVLLQTLVVNHVRGPLHNAVVHGGAPRGGARVHAGVPRDVDGLPRARRVWSRRAATAIFPKDATRWDAPLTQLAVLEVGGVHAADQLERLAFVQGLLAERS